uniref:Uncharacterized protein n=1 Tax=Brassica oleracea TaxID=3712 RepID=A0A3P5ZZS2_BRAOL|nr:unnamed protein product [Brassica oleracea]
MAQKICMVMMMVMVLVVTTECATINQATEGYGSCITDCVEKCGTDERCRYHCRWICPKPHSPQVILKDEAILPQQGRNAICYRNCLIKCGNNEACMHACLEKCPQ